MVGRLTCIYWAMDVAEPLEEIINPLLPRVQELGDLQQFDTHSFVLYLITAGAAPLGLSAFSNQILQTNILSEEQTRHHIDRVIQTLFPRGTYL